MTDQLHLVFLSAFLFVVGLVAVITKRNLVMMLMGVEFMLNAANLNLILFGSVRGTPLQGQMFALFVIVIAVCEVAVGLAIVIRVYKQYQSSAPDNLNELTE